MEKSCKTPGYLLYIYCKKILRFSDASKIFGKMYGNV